MRQIRHFPLRLRTTGGAIVPFMWDLSTIYGVINVKMRRNYVIYDTSQLETVHDSS